MHSQEVIFFRRDVADPAFLGYKLTEDQLVSILHSRAKKRLEKRSATVIDVLSGGSQ